MYKDSSRTDAPELNGSPIPEFVLIVLANLKRITVPILYSIGCRWLMKYLSHVWTISNQRLAFL